MPRPVGRWARSPWSPISVAPTGSKGDPATTLGALGYTLDDVETVPAAWLALVPAGVSLSPEAAWQTVTVNR